jgi:hypothetical protein
MKNLKEYSSIGYSLVCGPILELCEKLFKRKFEKTSKIKTSVIEHSYSASIIILCAVVVESYLNKKDIIEKDEVSTETIGERIKVFKSSLQNKLQDLFIVRNSIVHNYIWETQYSYGKKLQEKNIETLIKKGCGNKAFEQSVNKKTGKTISLNLNIIPTKLCKEDVLSALKVTSDFFDEEKEDVKVFYNSQQMNFSDFQKKLENSHSKNL